MPESQAKRRKWVTLLGATLLSAGCVDPGEGVEPPLSQIYFPVGVALSAGKTRMYVVSSDFDLQYSGGSVLALDLERVRELVPKSCSSDADCGSGQRCDLVATSENRGKPSHWCVAADGAHAGRPCGARRELSSAGTVLFPGRCGHVNLTNPQDGGKSLVVDSVGIGAFATDVIYRQRPNGPGGRLFIPVRGDATLHFIDTIDETEAEQVPFELECGQTSGDPQCDDRHRRGDDPEEENTRGLRLAKEPFGIAATPSGNAVVLTHQTEGTASLFVNDAEAWGDGQGNFGVGPKLEFAVGNMPKRPIGVVALPEPALITETQAAPLYQPGFLVTFRDAPEVRLLRYFDDLESQPPRPFIQQSGGVGITANSLGFDSRGIAVDASRRKECEAACSSGAQDCLAQCAGVALDVFVANRTPSSFLVGQTRPNASLTSSDDLPQFKDSIPLPFGPSRVVIGQIIDREGLPATRIFAICFDARKIGIYDPVRRRFERWVQTGRGPHALVTDATDSYALGYVAHFTDSYVGVLQLDQRSPYYGSMLLTLGRPIPPRTSK